MGLAKESARFDEVLRVVLFDRLLDQLAILGRLPGV